MKGTVRALLVCAYFVGISLAQELDLASEEDIQNRLPASTSETDEGGYVTFPDHAQNYFSFGNLSPNSSGAFLFPDYSLLQLPYTRRHEHHHEADVFSAPLSHYGRSRTSVSAVTEKSETPVTAASKPQGRTFGFLADLFLSAHCFLSECKKSTKRADYCCSRSYNNYCCQYTVYHHADYFDHYAAHDPGAVVGGLPFAGAPALDGFTGLPLNRLPHGAYPGYYPYRAGPYGGVRAPVVYSRYLKSGECPGPRAGYGWSDIGLADVYGPLAERSTCATDFECPGNQKCCHVEVRRSLFSRRCRFPQRDPFY